MTTQATQQELSRRLGEDWQQWVRKGLWNFLCLEGRKLGLQDLYREEEYLALAFEAAVEYVADPARRGASLQDFVPRSRGDLERVRAFVARCARNDLLAQAREDLPSVWIEVQAQPAAASRVQRQRYRRFDELAINELAQSFAHEHTLEGSLSSYMVLQGVQDPLLKLLHDEDVRNLDAKVIFFAEEVQAQWEHVRRNVPTKAARTERLLVEHDRVNSAFLLFRALHSVEPQRCEQDLPLMMARWVHGRNTPARLWEFAKTQHAWLTKGLELREGLAIAFQEEALQLLRRVRDGGYVEVDEQVRAQVFEDVRMSLEGWRGRYNTSRQRDKLDA